MLPTPKSFAQLADIAALAGLIVAEIETRKEWDPRSEEEIGNSLLRELRVTSFRRQVYALRLLQRYRHLGYPEKPRRDGVVIAMRGAFS